jgi:uncharacterized repeat protein (TIGR03843 family)
VRPDRLRDAPIEVVGRFASASNATLLVRLERPDGGWPELVVDDDGELVTVALDPHGFAVYKPQVGETPLWDFPDGTLHRREVAAHVVSELLDWDLVPRTVLREDAPHGIGALQRFVPHDPERHYFTLLEQADPGVLAQLRRMVLFDLLIDNADRKAGHVLSEDGRIRLVDHGVSFHVERKLRTVAWQFADEPVDLADRQALASLAGRLAQRLATPPLEPLLAPDEIERLVERADEVARLECFPRPTGPRPYPWPLV